jgi:dipeptidyl aminopeptidase/acylaminoacyl peptidase
MPLPAGARLGPYEVLSPIGAGGMGEVYRAVDTRLGRSVAIKVLPESLSSEMERLKRFEKEARAASSLNHPSIVTIYDIGTWDSRSYIAMELLDGKTVRELLHAGPISLKRLLSVAAQFADGLAKAHEAGIVHRDLKPENLMVTRDGFGKILDFGLAKLTQAGEERSGESALQTMTKGTEPGVLLGTAGYMSPEQASGRALDFRSDQFSFGAILYEMATGKRAFERATAVQTLSAIIQDEAVSIATANPKLPANFCWIVERCLSKEPEDRYGSTKDLARDLAALRDHASEIFAPAALGPAVRRRAPRRSVAMAGVAAIALAIAAFIGGEKIGIGKAARAPRPTFRALTFRRGHITGARFAPDQQTVVYSAAWDGKPSEIFTTRVDSPESRPLGIFPAGVLSISPTGEMAIAFGCEDRQGACFGTLARVPLAGGAPREVLEDVGSADWAPDGKTLAVVHAVEGKDRLENPIGKIVYQTEGLIGHVRVSPLGDSVAFVEYSLREGQGAEACVIDRTGRKRRLAGPWMHMAGLSWNRTGDEILVTGNPTGSHHLLYAVDLSGKLRTMYRWPGGGRIWDVSREGRVLLDQGQARSHIAVLISGSEKERPLSWFDRSVAGDLSNDGRKLLFYEYGEATQGVFNTYLRPTEGSDPVRLGEGKALALSPDEKWGLAMQSSPTPHLVLLPTGAGESRDLPPGGKFTYHWAAWFPDNTRIVFAAEEEGHPPRSYIQDVSGGPPRPFGENGMRATVVSPDGKQIALSSSVDGETYLCPVDDGGVASSCRPIPGMEPGDFPVQWSADGGSLFVRGAEEQPLTLYLVNLKTGRRDRWKELSPAESAGLLEYGSGPKGVRVTPDGRSYAYTYWTRISELYLAEGLK